MFSRPEIIIELPYGLASCGGKRKIYVTVRSDYVYVGGDWPAGTDKEGMARAIAEAIRANVPGTHFEETGECAGPLLDTDGSEVAE